MNRIICITFLLILAAVFMADSADAGQKARAHSKSSVNAPARNAGGNNKGNNNRGNNNNNNNNNNNRNSNKNVNRNTNVNRNSNVNIDRDIDVDIDVDHRGGYHGGGCCYHDNYHPIATAAAITATAIVVGSIVNTLPPSCSTVIVNGYAYQQCGNTWYQPQMSGSSTTYIVVNNPPGY